MAYQGISTGTIPNDGTGDTLAGGAKKVNENFTEIYDSLGDAGVIGNATLGQVSCTGIITASSFVGNINASSLNQGTIPNGRFPATIPGDLSGNAATASSLFDSVLVGGIPFNGASSINLPGVNTEGDQDTTGNAATATALETARNIGGVSFNGTANINLPGVNQTGNQDTSGNAATATVATRVSDTAAPASASATGTAGEVRYDSSFIYVCVATDTWVRAALATWT
jgi:hypothetical protein